MKDMLQNKVDKYNQTHSKKKRWQRAVSALAAVAVFCTTYAMIVPAITWERSLVCQIPEHHHVDSCYEMQTVPGEKKLVCHEAEHVHVAECYEVTDNLICGLEESEGHTHNEDCFDEAGELVCSLEESEGHSHLEACYEKTLVCQTPVHEHSDSCWVEAEPREEMVLVCGLEEHEHTAACFDAPPAEDDGYYCGQIEHIHSEEQYCYLSDGSRWCTIPEHVHTLACRSNPNADKETASKWEQTFENVELTGNWAEDVVAIAETQLGYTESTRNYKVQSNGTSIKGITRYGQWYGIPYGDWCAMFCSFCMNYAGVDNEQMPFAAGCETWIDQLTDKGIYHEASSEYEPKPGDLVFFNLDEDATADHVGLVYEIHEDGITTIEGNWGDCVCTAERKFADGKILGYGELPENPNPTDTDTARGIRTIESAPAADGAIAVITGNILEGAAAEIEAVELSEEQLIEYFGEEKAAAMTGFVAYDITIRVNGEEWQPDESVSVVIKHPDIRVFEGENLSLAHVDSMTQEVSEVEPTLKDNGDIEFTADGFSLYIAYTVDFHYEGLTYSIEGGSEILLSEIFEQLGINLEVNDAISVVFSDSSLVEVTPVYAEDDVTIVDWKMISKNAFQTEEKLTITFCDGKVLEIAVTDAPAPVGRGVLWDYSANSLAGAGISIVHVSDAKNPVVSDLYAWIPTTSTNAPTGWYTYCTKTGTDSGKIRLQNGEEYYLYVSCPNAGFTSNDKGMSPLPSFWPCQGYNSYITEPKNIVVAWLEDVSGNIAKLDNVIVGNEGTSSTYLWQFGGESNKTIYTNGTLSYDKLEGPAILAPAVTYNWNTYGTRVTVQDRGIVQGIKSDADGYYTLWMTPFFVDDVNPPPGGDQTVYAHRGVDEVGVFEITEEEPIECTITKQFKGLTTGQIAALADDFCITIINADTDEIAAELSISENPEAGKLAPNSISTDGTKFTWTIQLLDGVYTITESGAKVIGYDLIVTGIGTIIISKENGEVPISGEYEIADGYEIVLSDDIISSGNVIATVKKDGKNAALPEGAHLEWFKSLDGVDWERIIRTEYVTGNGAHVFNIPADTLSVNVSLTNGARTAAGSVRYKAVIYADTGEASIVESSAFIQDAYWGEIQNGSFETPVVAAGIGTVVGGYNGDYFYAEIPSGSNGVSWKSAVLGSEVGSPGLDIELARTETENQRYGAWTSYHNVPTAPADDYKSFTAVEGKQFAEINCEADGALYQDILTEPGTTMYWQLAHRARREATTADGAADTMYVVCMSVSQAEDLTSGPSMRAAVAEILDGDPNENYPGAVAWTISDNADQWVYHNGSFVVPDGQYLTRFFFVASNENAVGRLNAGNLVDDISLSTSLPPVENQYARVIIQKEIVGVQADELNDLRNGLMFEYSYDTISDSVYGSDMTWAATGTGQYVLTVPVQNGSAVFHLSEDGTSADLDDYSRFTSVTSTGNGTYSNGIYSVTVNGGNTITLLVRNFYIPDVVIVNEYELQRILVTITKQFEGLTAEQIDTLADEFCITVSEEDTGDTVAVLSLLDDPGDGKLAPDSVSEDGMKYTWKVSLPIGVYLLSESGADLPGYTRITEGLGTITVEASGTGGGDIPVDPRDNAMERATEARGELWDYSAPTLGESGIEVIRVDNIRDAVEAKLVEGWQPASSANAPAGWATFCTNTGSDNGLIKLSNGEEYYLYIACQYRDFANGARAPESSLPCVIPCEEGGFYLDFTQRCIVVAWLEDGSGNKVILDNVCVGNEGASTLFLWQFGGGSPKRIYTNDALDYNAFSLDMSAYGWDNGNHATRVTHTDQHRYQGIKPDAEGYYTLWMTPFYNDGAGTALPLNVGVDEIAVFEINDASVTVAKQVVGNDEETGSFGFTIQYTDPADNVMEETFSLADGEHATFYVKSGTDVTITETETDAYVEAFKVTGDAVDYTEGCTAVIHNVTGRRQVTYKNVFGADSDVDIHNAYTSGYKLPDTGGIGVYPIYALGVLLIAGSIVYGCILRRKRERRAKK